MEIIDLETIRRVLSPSRAIDSMRAALIAQSGGECDTPMPMHLQIPAEKAEIHVKSSYRRDGKYFAVKVAAGFPLNPSRDLPAGNGFIVLVSAETGSPTALLDDAGYLTDLRTAAVAAMVARELGRADESIGILGTGIQARFQARLHASALPLRKIWIWGRTAGSVERCVSDIRASLPDTEVEAVASPADAALRSRLIVTATASRAPLLRLQDLLPGTHVSAVGSDSTGKQELEPEILEQASLLLVDSLAQCEKLGELQHAPGAARRAIEIGSYCLSPISHDRDGITVSDFTGLGTEDLFVAEQTYDLVHAPPPNPGGAGPPEP
jgi:ornithine cyclodeaminase